MKKLPIVEIDFKEAKALADKVSIFQDLSFVIDVLKKLAKITKEKSQNNNDHVLLLRALWSSALIAYVRCFSTGKRLGLTKDIYKDLKGEPIKTHEYYRDLRDKHIAHSVNPFEQIKVGAILSNEQNDKKEVLGITELSQSLLVPDIDGIQTLSKLAIFARKMIIDEIKQSREIVAKIAKNIPTEDLYRGRKLRLVTPGPEDTKKPREY